jgi:hypothetical protein
MAKQKQQQVSPEDFTPEEQQQMQHYGQALTQAPSESRRMAASIRKLIGVASRTAASWRSFTAIGDKVTVF